MSAVDAGEEPENDAASEPTPRMMSWARNSAAYRLSRRMLTEKQLRDAIARKAREKFEGISAEQVRALSELAIAFGRDNGALDDQVYADIATRSGMRQGKSKRAIARKLAIKGVDGEISAEAVRDVDELHAAVILARKRALGPFRRAEADQATLAKETATFARAGFGFDIARRVCGMDREEADEIMIEARHG